jgi:hypothetical protein
VIFGHFNAIRIQPHGHCIWLEKYDDGCRLGRSAKWQYVQEFALWQGNKLPFWPRDKDWKRIPAKLSGHPEGWPLLSRLMEKRLTARSSAS